VVRKSSDPSPYYNCIAFAAGEDTRWWWPDPYGVYYWPLGVQREITVAAFVEAFRTLGYEVCQDGACEEGFEKIVLYVRIPTMPITVGAKRRWAVLIMLK
jgi:hypothetical protein